MELIQLSAPSPAPIFSSSSEVLEALIEKNPEFAKYRSHPAVTGADPLPPCIHRGPYTGATVQCPTCPNGARLKLYPCSHLTHRGVCAALPGVEDGVGPVQWCSACTDRVPPPPDPVEPDLPRPPVVEGVGVVIGCYGWPALARLQALLLRQTCGLIPVLLADDGSERDADFNAIESSYPGVTFWPSDRRRGHYAGDLSAFWKGLQWGAVNGLKTVIKVSQRFLWTEPDWIKTASDALDASGEATLMQDCIDDGGGNIKDCRLYIRSECVGFNVQKWIPYYREFDVESGLHNPTELYLWHRVHSYFGEKYCEWPGMTVNRYRNTPGTLWHGSHHEQPYHDLASKFGVALDSDFTCGASEAMPNWKRG